MGAAQQLRGFTAFYPTVGNLDWEIIINGVCKKGAESLGGVTRSLEEGFKYWQEQRRLDKLLSMRAADEISRKKTAAGT